MLVQKLKNPSLVNQHSQTNQSQIRNSNYFVSNQNKSLQFRARVLRSSSCKANNSLKSDKSQSRNNLRVQLHQENQTRITQQRGIIKRRKLVLNVPKKAKIEASSLTKGFETLNNNNWNRNTIQHRLSQYENIRINRQQQISDSVKYSRSQYQYKKPNTAQAPQQVHTPPVWPSGSASPQPESDAELQIQNYEPPQLSSKVTMKRSVKMKQKQNQQHQELRDILKELAGNHREIIRMLGHIMKGHQNLSDTYGPGNQQTYCQSQHNNKDIYLRNKSVGINKSNSRLRIHSIINDYITSSDEMVNNKAEYNSRQDQNNHKSREEIIMDRQSQEERESSEASKQKQRKVYKNNNYNVTHNKAFNDIKNNRVITELDSIEEIQLSNRHCSYQTQDLQSTVRNRSKGQNHDRSHKNITLTSNNVGKSKIIHQNGNSHININKLNVNISGNNQNRLKLKYPCNGNANQIDKNKIKHKQKRSNSTNNCNIESSPTRIPDYIATILQHILNANEANLSTNPANMRINILPCSPIAQQSMFPQNQYQSLAQKLGELRELVSRRLQAYSLGYSYFVNQIINRIVNCGKDKFIQFGELSTLLKQAPYGISDQGTMLVGRVMLGDDGSGISKKFKKDDSICHKCGDYCNSCSSSNISLSVPVSGCIPKQQLGLNLNSINFTNIDSTNNIRSSRNIHTNLNLNSLSTPLNSTLTPSTCSNIDNRNRLLVSNVCQKMRYLIQDRKLFDKSMVRLKLLKYRSAMQANSNKLQKQVKQSIRCRKSKCTTLSLLALQQILVQHRFQHAQIQIILARVCTLSDSINSVKYEKIFDYAWIEDCDKFELQ